MQKDKQSSSFRQFINTIAGWLINPHPDIEDISQQRKARLTAFLAYVLAFTNGLGMIFVGARGIDASFISLAVLAVFSFASYIFSRTRNYFRGSVMLVAMLSIIGFSLVIFGSENPIIALATTIPLSFVISSALLAVWGTVLLVSANVLGILILSALFPLFSFLDAGLTLAILIPLGSLLISVQIFRNNLEKARLQEVQIINQELRELGASLEQRVADATHDLKLAAEVARRLSLVRAKDIMLNEAVEIIRERFDLYYTQIYLIDPTDRALVLQAGSGEVGKSLLSRGHRLPLDMSSINGIAATERRAVIVGDTESDPLHRANPLLPDTRSEMVVPLLEGEQVVGVLDMQSSQKGTLNSENLAAFEALAGQLAIAISNSDLFEEAERARAKVEAQTRRLTSTGWHEFMDAIERSERLAYFYDRETITPLRIPIPESKDDDTMVTPIQVAGVQLGKMQFQRDEAWAEDDYAITKAVSEQVAQQIENLRLLAQAEHYQVESQKALQRLTQDGWEEYHNQFPTQTDFVYQDFEVKSLSDNETSFEESLTYEIKVRDEPIGELEIAGLDSLSKDDAELVSYVNDQLSAHIENLRLTVQTQMALAETADQAERVEILYDIGRNLNTATNSDEILSAVIGPAQQSGCTEATLFYIDDYDGFLPSAMSIAANWRSEGDSLFPVRHQFDFHDSRSPQFLFASPSAPQTIADIPNDDRVNGELKDIWAQTGSQAVAIIPILQIGTWLGILTFSWPDIHEFNEQEIEFYEAINSLITPVVQNHRLFDQIQAALHETETFRQLAEASGQGIGIGTMDGICSYVNPRMLEMLGLDKTSDIVGKPFTPLYPEEYQQKLDHEIMPQLIQTGNWTGELALTKADGTIFPTLDNFFLLTDESGKPQFLVDIVTDITERRNQEQATIKRAAELAIVADLGTTISTILEEEQLLETVVKLTRDRFNLYHCHIFLADEDNRILKVEACGWEQDSPHTGTVEHVLISTDQEQSLVAQAARDQNAIIVNNVRDDSNWLPNKLLPNTHSEMAIPIVAGNQILGVLDVQSDEVDRFTDEDISIMITLTSQVAVALQNARTHAQTQQQAKNEAMINMISQRIQNTTSVESALQVAIRELGQALGAKRTNVQLGLPVRHEINNSGNGSSPK